MVTPLKSPAAKAMKILRSPEVKYQIAIVASRFNAPISEAMLKACLDELKKQGIAPEHVSTHWVPGAFEIPLVAMSLASRRNIDGVICLGAIIRGDTYHFEVVANEVARGIMDVSLKTQKPIIMGVLTTNTLGQAEVRSQAQKGVNKGRDAALTLLEMFDLLKKMK